MARRGLGGHFAVNTIGTVLTLVVSIVTVPIYVHQVGDARYGVLSIVWLLLGYFGFLDLGLSRASTNVLARLSDGSDDERSRIVATSFALNLVLGCVGSLILYGAGGILLERVVSVPDALRPEIAGALPWVAALLPLALVSGVAVGTLEARERFVAANVLQVLGTSFGQVAPVIVAVMVSPSLAVVIPAAVIARAAGVFLIIGFVLAFNGPWTAFRADRSVGGRLLGYGGWVTVSGVISPVLQSLDQVLIGSILGVAAVTYYAIPMGLVIRSQLFAAALSRTLFPRMSRLDDADSRVLTERALVTLAFGYAAICAPATIVAKPFVALWIGPAFGEVAGPVAQVLLVGAWVNGLAFIPFSFLQAQGRPDLTAKFHLVEALPFIGVLWALSHAFGIIGAAVAWSLRVVLDAGLLFAAARIGRGTLLRIAPAAGGLLACFLAAQVSPAAFWPAFGVAFLAGCGMVALAALFDPQLRAMLRAALAGRPLGAGGTAAD